MLDEYGLSVKPGLIIPFSTTREAFIAAIAEAFVTEDYAPNDIFRKTDFSGIQPSYLPVYRYLARFEGNWNCERGIDNIIESKYCENGLWYTKKDTITVWGPCSGLLSGEVESLALGCENGDLPRGLGVYADDFSYSWDMAESFDTERFIRGGYDPGNAKYQIYPLGRDSEDAWVHGGGRDRASSAAGMECRKFEPHGKIRNFNYEFRLVDPKVALTLVPYWYAEFSYEGVSCYAIMDGRGTGMRVCIPTDKARVRKVKLFYKISAGAFIVFIIAFILKVTLLLRGISDSFAETISNTVLGVVFFVWVGLIITAMIAEKSILSSARDERRAIANKLSISK